MFIFQSKEDEIRVSQRFPKINSTVMTPNEVIILVSANIFQVRSSNINVRIPSKLKEFGFDCFAVEMLQGPEIVLNYLCQVNGVSSFRYFSVLVVNLVKQNSRGQQAFRAIR